MASTSIGFKESILYRLQTKQVGEGNQQVLYVKLWYDYYLK